MTYKFGNFVAKSIPWKKFYSKLKQYEKQYNIKLILARQDFNINKSKILKKPFKKGNIIDAEVKCRARLPNNVIAAADNRNITIINCNKPIGAKIKIKILKAKHNMFFAEIKN